MINKKQSTIFQLQIIRYHPVRNYPLLKINANEYGIFYTLNDSEQALSQYATQTDIYCFIIREFPIGRIFHNRECLTERIYMPNGEKKDERLYSSINNEGFFNGRIFFPRKEGEIMEVLDLTEQCIRLSIVIWVPPTPQEIEDRKNNPYWNVPIDECPNCTDDFYLTKFVPKDFKEKPTEEYVDALYVFTPRFFVKPQLKEQLLRLRK